MKTLIIFAALSGSGNFNNTQITTTTGTEFITTTPNMAVGTTGYCVRWGGGVTCSDGTQINNFGSQENFNGRNFQDPDDMFPNSLNTRADDWGSSAGFDDWGDF